MQKQVKKSCELCFPAKDSENSILLRNIEKRLREHQIIYQGQETLSGFSNQTAQGFYRILRVIFGSKLKYSKGTNGCKHEVIKKKWMQRLHCSCQDLNMWCQKLSLSLGKSNYHLDTLSQQIKGFYRYITADAKIEQISSEENVLQAVQQKEKSPQLPVPQSRSRAEEGEEQEGDAAVKLEVEVSPSTHWAQFMGNAYLQQNDYVNYLWSFPFTHQ